MPDDYGVKIARKNKSARSKDRLDHAFNSALATYMVAQKKIVSINANPYVVIHNLSYVPKVLVYQVLSDHNRKLPYNDDLLNWYDFSITKNEIKIRGVTSGTFVIYIFAQPIL